MIFRVLKSSDTLQVLRLVAGLEGQGQWAEFFWPAEQLTSELITAQTNSVWIENELIAFMAWRDLGIEAEITVLAVARPWQAQGKMAQLLKQTLNSSHHKSWFLEVHEKNTRAIHLYSRLGFVFVGRREHYYRDGTAALIMRFVSN